MRKMLILILLIFTGNLYSKDNLQKIFDTAGPNSRIIIKSGIYKGNFVVTKPLEITGTGKTIIKTENEKPALTIKSKNVKISGLTIAGNEYKSDSSLEIDADNVIIINNNVKKGVFGIYLNNVKHCVVKENLVEGSIEEKVYNRGNAIQVSHGGYNIISKNRIYYVKDGIYLDYTKNNIISKNSVFNSHYGYHFMFSFNNELSENITKNSVVGAMIMNSDKSKLSNNNFSGQRNVNGCGIYAFESRNCLFEKNKVTANRTGFSIDKLSNSFIKRNIIANNAVAIQKTGNVEKIFITENNIVGNIIQTGGKAVWSCDVFSYKKKGNYWDDYRGYDFNKNRIGDGAYRSNNKLETFLEKNSQLGIFFGSPICSLLESLNLSDETNDLFPLIKPEKIN
jgi:nitrous oxidase accessory protein